MTESVPPACTEAGLPNPAPMTGENLAKIAKALGHPARVRILEQFDRCVPNLAGEVVESCQLAQSTVSEHLRILREADILFARKDGPRTWYCVRRSVLHAFARALEDLAVEPVLHRNAQE